MARLEDHERRAFWEIGEDRYQTRSTILTSQLPVADWHRHIGDPTLADGILDRPVHSAHRIELRGVLWRFLALKWFARILGAMTLDEQELIVKTAGEVSKQAVEASARFFDATFGEPLRELGGLWADKIRFRRWINRTKMAAKAEAMLHAVGVEPGAIPLNLGVPLLESGSLVEDPSLQELWANLLANAADPREVVKVSPAFLGILRDLLPRQAKFLEEVYKGQMTRLSGYVYPVKFDRVRLRHMYTSVNEVVLDEEMPVLAYREAEFAIDLLLRHGLLQDTFEVVPHSGPGISPTESVGLHKMELTHLGYFFIRACRPPEPSNSPPA